VTLGKRDRGWFGVAALAAWLLAFGVTAVGALIAWALLGAGLCEDDDSPGSDTYCNAGGMEASALAIAALVVLALLVPVTALVAGKRRLFWIGLISPLPLGVVVVVLATILGTD
jgi:hypothetical protein